jgi:hypothetical protein
MKFIEECPAQRRSFGFRKVVLMRAVENTQKGKDKKR